MAAPSHPPTKRPRRVFAFGFVLLVTLASAFVVAARSPEPVAQSLSRPTTAPARPAPATPTLSASPKRVEPPPPPIDTARAARWVGASHLFVIQRRALTAAIVHGSATQTLPLPRADGQGPPNILLITVDTLRADHLGTYGYRRRTSPNIDRLARSAAVFEQARAAGPMTRFSMAPMLTGRHFSEISRSAPERWPVIHEDEVMMAERLSDAGYHTAAFHTVDYFHPNNGMAQGFDHFDISCFSASGCRNFRHAKTSRYITDRAIAYLDAPQLPRDQPFFMWVYYSDPHSDFRSHGRYERDLPGDTEVDHYDQEIRHTDTHIGRLLKALDERGATENTIIFFISDHGEGLVKEEDHYQVHHGANLYDEIMRVPLIVRGPGISPQRIETPVSLLDLVPTMNAIADVPSEPWRRGVSLVPYLKGERPPHPPVFFEKLRSQTPDLWPKGRGLKGMVAWPYKVIWTPKKDRFKVFDLSSDPHERRNLFKRLEPAERDRIIEPLRAWAEHTLTPVPMVFEEGAP